MTIGAYDRAVVCELIGNYLLHKLSKLYEKNDIVLKKKSGPESEKIKKAIQSIFRENELKLTTR